MPFIDIKRLPAHYVNNNLRVTFGRRARPALLQRQNLPPLNEQQRPVPCHDGPNRPDIQVIRQVGTVQFTIENAHADISQERLQNMSDVVNKLNRYIPRRPLKSIKINDKYKASYERGIDPALHAILMPSDYCERDDYLKTIAHEMGHALFDTLIRHKKTSEWDTIFLLCVGSYGATVVWDRNFAPTHLQGGHPYDNPSELFASSVAAFTESSEAFRYIIANRKDEGEKKGGILLYCYLRDEVFGGIFVGGQFFPNGTKECESQDTLNGVSWRETAKGMIESGIIEKISKDHLFIKTNEFLGTCFLDYCFATIKERNSQADAGESHQELTIDPDRLIQPLINLYGINMYRVSLHSDIRMRILTIIGKHPANDTRFIEILLLGLNDEFPTVRQGAADFSKYKIKTDNRFSLLIVFMLNSFDPSIRKKARKFMKDMKIGQERIKSAVINCLQDANGIVRLKAIVAARLLKRKDERYVQPLLAALSDSDPRVREESAKTIAELKMKDKGFLPALLDLLKDKNIMIVESAKNAIVAQNIKDEYLVSSLLKLISADDVIHKFLIDRLLDQLGIRREI